MSFNYVCNPVSKTLTPEPDRLIREAEVRRRTGIGKTTRRTLIAKGKAE